MDAVKEAKRFVGAGEFTNALKALNAGEIDRSRRSESEVLRAELLERLGEHSASRAFAEQLLRSRKLTAGERSACTLILARADAVEGHFDSAIAHLQRAVTLATSTGDYERACWAQLRLLVLLSERSGSDAIVPLLAELRANAGRTGNPAIMAALHVFVGQTEAKRGLTSNANRHLRIAASLLHESPNAWLDATVKQIQTAIAIIRADFDEALCQASAGVELAELCGASNVCAASLGNLANVLFLTGDYEGALQYYDRALERFPPRSDSRIATLDSLVHIRLAQGRSEECDRLLSQINELLGLSDNRTRYAYRHALLTRVHTWSRTGRVQQAIEEIDTVLDLAKTSNDEILLHVASLTKAELLARASRVQEAIQIIRQISVTVTLQPPDICALYERTLAFVFREDNHPKAARSHFARAKRLYEGLHHRPGLDDLELSWAPGAGTSTYVRDMDDEADAGISSANITVHCVATLMAHGGRPEILARELITILRATGCATWAKAVVRRAEGVEHTLATFGSELNTLGRLEHFAVRETQHESVEIVAALLPGLESSTTVHSLKQLLQCAQNVERARIEHEERTTLWPLEDLLIDDKRAVISGQMRNLMNSARRVARTKVNVLITGESGTGKEILARAIHEFSDRSARAFVPFNCTAIPRDLLESQLFGHRRGAFTGADRDQLGLIRTARDGTLFLDEVGEMGLDLQPKLLRFIESGEISPLGEPGSLTIDVRIVAATNANLEDAVRAGRFREDLFYRLNVVRLSIPPLRERRDEIPGLVNHFVARAADEFKKGHLRVAEETMERLLLYRWPGNVRQLQNEMRRMVALAEPDSTLLPHAISEDILGALPIFRRPAGNSREIAVDLHDKLMPAIAHVEREMIKAALRAHDGKVHAVAKALGISRKGLYLKRQRLGL
jgi:transcriptional regulator with PAS, ATPase and Fis domain/tetratricopeptide (TPR) repeat protein